MTEDCRHGVVIACRGRDGRWLMVRRADTVERAPGKVGFPGGEIHTGESQERAVEREAREELGVAVRPLRCVWRHHWRRKGWVLWGWSARIIGGRIEPNPDEIAEVLWLCSREAAEHPDALPTNRLFIAALDRAAGL